MKKLAIFLAVAALAACSKSEVKYDTPAEIGFAPAMKNITKASGLSGNLATSQELGIWAYWDKDATPGAVVVEDDADATAAAYAGYDDDYLVNALFVHKNGSWGGAGNGYPWPVNGALVFAGYTTPGDDVLATGTAVEYALGTDVMTFKNYANTSEFDLCWFGRTASSFNNRADGTAVDVNLSHALAWVSVAVCGEGSPVNNWTITSMSMSNVATAGTATCSGATRKATWAASATSDAYNVFTGTQLIPAATEEDGKTTGTTISNNVLIPSDDVQLTVNYSFTVNGQPKTDSKTVTLNTEVWQSGIHYTYTLFFKGNEILVAPSYDGWGSSDQTITVQ